MKILIADDSRVGRSYIERALTIGGVSQESLITAKNGQEAFEIIEKQGIEMLFLDINMPVLDGIQLVEKLHQNNKLASLKVIITSSLIDENRKTLLESKGVKHFLKKPFSPEALNSVYQLLRG